MGLWLGLRIYIPGGEKHMTNCKTLWAIEMSKRHIIPRVMERAAAGKPQTKQRAEWAGSWPFCRRTRMIWDKKRQRHSCQGHLTKWAEMGSAHKTYRFLRTHDPPSRWGTFPWEGQRGRGHQSYGSHWALMEENQDIEINVLQRFIWYQRIGRIEDRRKTESL